MRQWLGDYFLKNLGEIVLPNSHFLSDGPLIVLFFLAPENAIRNHRLLQRGKSLQSGLGTS